MSEQTATRQLAVLARIEGTLKRKRIRFWLRGGWAIDFMLGEITRDHADIDLLIWNRNRARAHAALLDAGCTLVRETPVQTDWVCDDQDITFIYVRRTADGAILTQGLPPELEWRWSEDALQDRQITLHGVPARVVNPRQLLTDIEAWEEATGRPLRPKDHQTIATLRGLVIRQRTG